MTQFFQAFARGMRVARHVAVTAQPDGGQGREAWSPVL